MQVNKEELNRLKYLEREIDNPHFKKVITSIINNIQVNNGVYVIQEEASWDYEFVGHTEVYSTYAEARKAFDNLKHIALTDMYEAIGEEATNCSLSTDDDIEESNFQCYKADDFTRWHYTLTIKRKEVMLNA